MRNQNLDQKVRGRKNALAPALLIKTFSFGTPCMNAAAPFLTLSMDDRSSSRGDTSALCPSGSSLRMLVTARSAWAWDRAATVTSAPRDASARAVSKPMPAAAPCRGGAATCRRTGHKGDGRGQPDVRN